MTNGQRLAAIRDAYQDLCALFNRAGTRNRPDYQWLWGHLEKYNAESFHELMVGMVEHWESISPGRRPKTLKPTITNRIKAQVASGHLLPDKAPAPPQKPQSSLRRAHYTRQDEAAAAWDVWLQEANRLCDPHTYSVWWSPTAAIGYDSAGAIVVAVPNQQFTDWLTNRVHPKPDFHVRYEAEQASQGTPGRH